MLSRDAAAGIPRSSFASSLQRCNFRSYTGPYTRPYTAVDMINVDKRAIVASIQQQLAAEIAVLTRAARDAHEAATHEEAKPENDKDTRSVEAAYLAGAQAERARDLERTASALKVMQLRQYRAGDAIGLAALVEIALATTGARQWCFMVGEGGGRRTKVGALDVQLVTPQSPLGRALMEAHVGDSVEVATPSGAREWEVRSVQ